MSDVDGFGFGLDICPIGCTLPEVPLGPGDPDPFDAPDIDPVTGTSCATTVTWTHDVTADLPPEAEVVGALLILNAAGIEPTTFPAILTADSTQFPLVPFTQGQLGSGLIPVPVSPPDLSDGLLEVTIQKGVQIGTFKLCDDQFYDVSVLILLINDAVE